MINMTMGNIDDPHLLIQNLDAIGQSATKNREKLCVQRTTEFLEETMPELTKWPTSFGWKTSTLRPLTVVGANGAEEHAG